eukprot:6236221-Pyramimonas_sp.AAC.1
MCPGKAHQRGLPDTFNDHLKEMIQMFTGRGIPVRPADQWISQQDRPHVNTWHPQKSGAQSSTVEQAVYACRYSQEPECGSTFAANTAAP